MSNNLTMRQAQAVFLALSLPDDGEAGMSDDLVKRLRAGTGDGLRAWDWMNEAADRIEELEWALQKHACDCKTCERPPEDRDDSCAANAALKGAATTEFVNVAGDVDHLIAEARREALEEARCLPRRQAHQPRR